jgi:hypothetical protein
MEFFDTFNFSMIFNKQMLMDYQYDKRIHIHREGVYYTFLAYEILNPDSMPARLGQDTHDRNSFTNNSGPHLLSNDSSRHLSGPWQADRQQVLTVRGEAVVPHLEISGDIVYRNQRGYLNGELKPYLTFYPCMVGFYAILGMLMGCKMYRYREAIISLHWYIVVVLVAALLECLFNFSVYSFVDRQGHFSTILSLVASICEIFRSTFSKLILLMIGLGYGISARSIAKYQTKIMVLCFLYMISQGAFLGIYYINHQSPISGSVAMIVSFPLSVLNSLFCMWIYFAFRRTLRRLEEKQQAFKLKIISRLFGCVCVCMAVYIFLFFVDVILVFSQQRDLSWKSEWLRESSWFWIFSLFMVIVLVILQPNERSKMLASV